MPNYRFSGARQKAWYNSEGSIAIHKKAFREVENCRMCEAPLSSQRNNCSTGLCRTCANKLWVTCSKCGSFVRVSPGGKRHNHLCFLDMPVREWRKIVLEGKILPKKDTNGN